MKDKYTLLFKFLKLCFAFFRYLFNVAYGVGKAACDRMAADCAHELKEDNVTMVSLWPGPVKTEYAQENILSKGNLNYYLNFYFCLSFFKKTLHQSYYQ